MVVFTFHGPDALTDDGLVGNDVSGTATYQGPAVGYYAIYQPLGGQSGTGRFQRHGERLPPTSTRRMRCTGRSTSSPGTPIGR